ncbi:MAG TPA: hypothetical protein HA224_04780 [Nanoarchaeota archaeon]|nr:hypothetical protein [Nanoarchaeota archaeon]
MAVKIYETENAGAVKKVLEAEDLKDSKTGKWIINEFKTQGYKFQDAASLGISKHVSYVYIGASDDFFKKHEKSLLDAGAKSLKGKEFEEVKKKIESSEDDAVAGMGAIFG